MAEVTINNSPVHSDSIITYPYGVADSGYSCGWHTGVDIAPYGTTENNPVLYPVKPRSCSLHKYYYKSCSGSTSTNFR